MAFESLGQAQNSECGQHNLSEALEKNPLESNPLRIPLPPVIFARKGVKKAHTPNTLYRIPELFEVLRVCKSVLDFID